ncbi:MAG: hydrolase [Opitutales bacterium]
MTPESLRDLLIRWCNQNSGSGNLAGLEALRGLLAAEFATLSGAQVESVALRGTAAQALRIRVRPEAPQQLLLSDHYDTVYGADHPFQRCDLTGADTLRGPGVVDSKGGIVVMLAALRALESAPHAAQLGCEIILSPDEEIGSAGTEPLLVEAARRHRLALVFEPARSNGDLVKSRKGTGIFTVTVHGRAAHAGRDPAAGRNAILALAELLPRIDALGRLPGVMVNIGRMAGGGAVNIVPDLALVEINARATQTDDAAKFETALREIIAPVNSRDGFRAEIAGRFNRLPKVETPAECALFAAWQRCASEVGVTVDWQHVGGGSDGNILSAAGLPNLDGVGPVGDHLHSPQEYIRLSSLTERAQIAARFMAGVARGEIALP